MLSDRCERRFAQDDGFVEEVENIWLGVQKHGKIEKVVGSRDENSVCVVIRSVRQASVPYLPFALRLPDLRLLLLLDCNLSRD
jgi:hypothetical protein